jgi:hypothetical protein|tara:strand:+ start:957 stop:1784 length:828 start_codon:yes stop_codon:yes gene_type:complete
MEIIKHTDIHNLEMFENDVIVSQLDKEINGIKYYGNDVMVNNARVGSFTKAYKVNRTDEMLRTANQHIMQSGINTSNVEIEDKKWAYGGVNQRTITFKDAVLDPVRGDEINPQMIFINSYNGTRKAMIAFGLIRMICSNGMIDVEGHVQFRKHTNTNILASEYGKIGDFKLTMDNSVKQLQSMNDTVVSLDQVRKALKETIAKNEIKENTLMEYIENNNRGSVDTTNLYVVYNGLTEWATHHEARATANMNEVYLNRQAELTKLWKTSQFEALAA